MKYPIYEYFTYSQSPAFLFSARWGPHCTEYFNFFKKIATHSKIQSLIWQSNDDDQTKLSGGGTYSRIIWQSNGYDQINPL